MLVAASGLAGADDAARERSRAAFRRGVTAASSGDYETARAAFLEAYRIFPHPSILLNLGIARAHTGEWVEAEDDLVRFLADDGGAQPDELASARAELAQTRTHLGSFRLRVTPSGARATLDTHPVPLIAGSYSEIRTTRGAHDLHVAADGYVPVDRVVQVSDAQGADVEVRLRSEKSTSPEPTQGRSNLAGWLLLGGGAVAAGVGIGTGIEYLLAVNAYNTSPAGQQDPAKKASGEVFGAASDIAFATALIVGGVGAYLLLTPSAATGNGQAGLVIGPWSGLTGRF